MNQVVLITGSATGIGRQIALKFAAGGWKVYASVKEINEESKDLHSSAKGLLLETPKLDVTNQSEVDHVVSEILKLEGRIDLLINNAGFGFVGPVEDFSIAEIQAQYDVNLFGTIRLIKAVVPTMRKIGSGKIINISSVNGLVSFQLYGIYSSSKFALETISEVLRFELEPFNIKVSLVEPGGFSTKFASNKKYPLQMFSEVSAYKNWASKMLNRLDSPNITTNSLIKKLMDPSRVADLAWEISNNSNPRLRYMIGIDTKFFVFARRILPYRVWKFCINRAFKWK
jgi:NAD(P)-dependent dehydrogenase (short-subunit alcohol dehydrogenase family)